MRAVLEWTHSSLREEGAQGDIVLLGSSAGAPIAGSAIDSFEYVRGYVGMIDAVECECAHEFVRVCTSVCTPTHISRYTRTCMCTQVSKHQRLAVCTGIGYVAGFLASILFSSHYQPLIDTRKPKLFVSGTRDEFTTPSQLRGLIDKMDKRSVSQVYLEEGVGHFALESPQYDSLMADLTCDFIRKHCLELPSTEPSCSSSPAED